jgi:predicted GNAT superfamily acetyltransferase
MVDFELRFMDTPQQMEQAEAMQLLVWPGSEMEIVPGNLLLTAVHNGGVVIGAYHQEKLAGFVFGFPGLVHTENGVRLKHCSHMLAVDPALRNQRIGFALKRAQWQFVRSQGIGQITWTYDPLMSRNAFLNIARLGAVCNTYLENEYGEMRDDLNVGLASDRFQVDWWLNSHRVTRRLSEQARPILDLAHFLDAQVDIINPSWADEQGLPHPSDLQKSGLNLMQFEASEPPTFALIEIPSDFLALKAASLALAKQWREHTRQLFLYLFQHGYLVTDFIHLPGSTSRSFYVLTYGESTL